VDVPVLVAGAGPVGLTLACELERLGVTHRIVDASPSARRSPAPRTCTPGLWLCAGAGPPDEAFALALRFATALRVRVFVIADRPPAAPPGVEAFADPALRAHGRLGAVSRAAYVVRPDGHLGFRCEPPDAAWLTERLSAIGIRVPAARAAR
jgi:threonine dehydrogenase-like Zn-dependent dehydrogenase